MLMLECLKLYNIIIGYCMDVGTHEFHDCNLMLVGVQHVIFFLCASVPRSGLLAQSDLTTVYSHLNSCVQNWIVSVVVASGRYFERLKVLPIYCLDVALLQWLYEGAA